jgi:hypothetical protein
MLKAAGEWKKKKCQVQREIATFGITCISMIITNAWKLGIHLQTENS